ncbi:hypothetical protein Tcan_00741, partial [Toxocara canis]
MLTILTDGKCYELKAIDGQTETHNNSLLNNSNTAYECIQRRSKEERVQLKPALKMYLGTQIWTKKYVPTYFFTQSLITAWPHTAAHLYFTKTFAHQHYKDSPSV